MIIAGTQLDKLEVAALAFKLLDAELNESAHRLVKAYVDEEPVFSISTQERVAFSGALDVCPAELLPFRSNLREALV